MNPRDWVGKNEKVAVFSLVGVLLLANLIAAGFLFGLFGSGTHYQHVSITYEDVPQGVQVTEQLVSVVSPSDAFRVLYRSFDDRICRSGCDIDIASVTCAGSSPYLSDTTDGVVDPQTGAALNVDADLQRRIHLNEVGCYGDGFAGTTETMTISYVIPTARLEANQYQHALFSTDHLRIDTLDVTGTQGKASARLLPANEPVTIDVRSGAVKTQHSFLLLIAILIIIAPIIIYYTLGKDPDDIVPDYLHTVPNNKREPWEVDVLVQGSNTLSRDGLGSIILSLYIKKIATVELQSSLLSTKLMLTVQKDAREAPTPMEQALLTLLSQTKEKETATATVYSYAVRQKDLGMRAFLMAEPVRTVYKNTYQNLGATAMWLLTIVAAALGWMFFPQGSMERVLMLTSAVVLFVSAFFIPPAVFGRFKGDYHKEYLEWLAFKHMLTDYAQIQGYLKEDYRQWQQWIVYATALGAAEKLLKAMKELDVINAAEYDRVSGAHVAALAVGSTVASSGGSGGGGGGGAGGGGGGGR